MTLKTIAGKTHLLVLIVAVSAVALIAPICQAAADAPQSTPERDKLIEDARQTMKAADPFMGDWEGLWALANDADSGWLVAKVIALGKGQYRANLHQQLNQNEPALAVLEGSLENGAVALKGRVDNDRLKLDVQCKIQGAWLTGKFKGTDSDGRQIEGSIELKKAFHASPALGAKPPADAIVLFDGKNFKQWKHLNAKEGEQVKWKLVKPNAMEARPGAGSIITSKEFTDFRLHIEFRTPFMPEARGQGRGNSGVYCQGRYEIQVLDSYALEGLNNDCGGIYGVARPAVNMCAPPGMWQTYDITFRAPRFDNAGKKTRDALLTVLHNGVKIHVGVKVPGPTTAAPDSNVTRPGGIYLQDHGNSVQYRNIWLVELPPEDS